uniref:Transmembrane protein n=1 Tax=Trypanosoma vivax (strain Y486) TaxID=1055687 RepID=G0UC00_TRYVY|nr:hypothetical protein, unlikely [Trypanosoma vivax Y486]
MSEQGELRGRGANGRSFSLSLSLTLCVRVRVRVLESEKERKTERVEEAARKTPTLTTATVREKRGQKIHRGKRWRSRPSEAVRTLFHLLHILYFSSTMQVSVRVSFPVVATFPFPFLFLLALFCVTFA